jgi:predicted nucleic-acid-binding Zn-ribbon protein
MSRYIDADALKEYIDCGHLRSPAEVCFSERDVVDLIDAQPTVDAVPVIRCKDCRYYEVYERKYDGSADKRFKPSICTRAYEYAVAKDPNWFCADAEPKEADG